MALIGAFTACFFVQVFLCRDHDHFFAWKIKVLYVPFRYPQRPCPHISSLKYTR